ncbi:MAG: hypothetical protein M0T74_04185 [Desulfitobacterium hafniense]|nr:hypothetical protein [Desulfitobacterium hafniense]
MKIQLITELAEDVLVQGLGLQLAEDGYYYGRVGRHEVRQVKLDEVDSSLGETFVIVVSRHNNEGGCFRPGDFLMTGSDEFIDKAFSALDELEQRGLVVNLAPNGEQHQSIAVGESLISSVQEWKNQKLPFFCLFLVEPVAEEHAKVAGLIRRIIG